MLNTLYHLFVPFPIRNHLYQSSITYYQQQMAAKLAAIEADLPTDILMEEHIPHLRIVPDREKLLQYLPKNGMVAEIGVDRGDFSQSILAANQPEKLHLIDSWIDPRHSDEALNCVKTRFASHIDSGNVQIHRGPSDEQLEHFPDHYFDFVYIDSDHSYRTTTKELDVCRRKVKSGGIIAGHDYVVGTNSGYRYGVIEAVNEFCVHNRWEMIYLTHERHRHLSYAITEIL